MEERHGVSTIVYDDKGKLFFLLLKRSTNWLGYEFPKAKIRQGEDVKSSLQRALKEKAGLTQYELERPLEFKREFVHGDIKYIFDIYLARSNMNLPVNHSKKKHNSYIWTDKSGVYERLHWDNEKDIFLKAVQEIQMAKRR